MRGAVFYSPLDQGEITDELACSRAELGSVYVTLAFPGESNIYELLAVKGGNIYLGPVMGDSWIWDPSEFRIATPDELKEAGLWN
jgi:hypothetical protein